MTTAERLQGTVIASQDTNPYDIAAAHGGTWSDARLTFEFPDGSFGRWQQTDDLSQIAFAAGASDDEEDDEDEEDGDDVCDLCYSSGVNVERTTFCGKTIGIECGCEDSEDYEDGSCGCDECLEALAEEEKDDL